MGVRLPEDYKNFLMESNGFEGSSRHGAYFQLWSTREMPEHNGASRAREFYPGVLLIGSDGGGEAFAISWNGEEPEYLAVPWIGSFPEDNLVLGRTFFEFVREWGRRLSADGPES